MAIDPARHEHERYLLELLDTTAKTVERTIRRLDQDMTSDRETLHLILRELREIRHDLESQPSPTPVTLSRSSAVRFSPPQ
jgi:hypothetical protein